MLLSSRKLLPEAAEGYEEKALVKINQPRRKKEHITALFINTICQKCSESYCEKIKDQVELVEPHLFVL